jgi:hypothetical protein
MRQPTTHSISQIIHSQPLSDRIGSGLFAVTLTAVAVATAYCVINAPHQRAVAEAELARTIAAEDRIICAKFGAADDSNRFADCSAILSDVRARQNARTAELTYSPL